MWIRLPIMSRSNRTRHCNPTSPWDFNCDARVPYLRNRRLAQLLQPASSVFRSKRIKQHMARVDIRQCKCGIFEFETYFRKVGLRRESCVHGMLVGKTFSFAIILGLVKSTLTPNPSATVESSQGKSRLINTTSALQIPARNGLHNLTIP